MKYTKKILSVILALLVMIPLSSCRKGAADDNVAPETTAPEIQKPTTGSFGGFDYTINAEGNAAITKYSGEEKSVRIPEVIDNCPVTKIASRAFYENESLLAVNIPDSITVIESEAFSGCTQLSAVKMGKSIKAVGGRAFYRTPFLASSTDEFFTVGDGVLLKYNGTSSKVKVPEGIKYVSSAFESNTKVTNVIFPSTLKEIGSYAFISCLALKEVSIPQGVVAIGECAFAKCETMTDITLPDSVETMGNMCFLYCVSLQTIKLPLNLTAIPTSAFQSCTSLTSVNIPSNVRSIENQAFLKCSALIEVTIPESTTSIGNIAFANCNEALVIKCKEGSAAEKYCKENDLTVEKQ